MNKYNLTEWEHPADYGGFSPDGDFVIYTQHRDSKILTQCNYELIMRDLMALSESLQTDDDEPFVYDFRAGHWAVGWVEYLLICKDAPEQLQAKAREILDALADYPVYDEMAYSERQCEAVSEYWDCCSDSEKLEWYKESGESIFALRRNYIPESLEQSEMFY